MDTRAPLQIDTFLPYMRDVSRCEQSLRELNLMWRMIESSAKMNCPVEAKAILPTMAATRAGFNRLEQELVSSLVREKVSNVLEEIGTKAQYVIDIVVRNLYERTADVGFLATDRELCAFVAGIHDDRDMIRAPARLSQQVHGVRRNHFARHCRQRVGADRRSDALGGQHRSVDPSDAGVRHLCRNLPRHRSAAWQARSADLLAPHAPS